MRYFLVTMAMTFQCPPDPPAFCAALQECAVQSLLTVHFHWLSVHIQKGLSTYTLTVQLVPLMLITMVPCASSGRGGFKAHHARAASACMYAAPVKIKEAVPAWRRLLRSAACCPTSAPFMMLADSMQPLAS